MASRKRSRSAMQDPPVHPSSSSSSSTTTTTITTQSTRSSERNKPKPQPPKPNSLVEDTNALSLPVFGDTYLPSSQIAALATAHDLRITLSSWSEMSLPKTRVGEGDGLDVACACLDLVEETSASHYRAVGEKGWQRHRKRKEMGHPAVRYLLLFPGERGGKQEEAGLHLGLEEHGLGKKRVLGFLSFMITEEDGFEVIYCYELHLLPELRGKGVGRALMEIMEMIGKKVGVEKAMLTVFLVNQVAVNAYEKWGYREDEFSPGPRRLKSGKVKESGYVILSKGREDFAGGRGQEQGDGLTGRLDNRKGVSEDRDMG